MAKGGGFYAVANGRNIGIYTTWDQCRAQIDGYPKPRYKKFPTEKEAQDFIINYQLALRTAVAADPSSSESSLTQSGASRKRKAKEPLPDFTGIPERLKHCDESIWKDAPIVYTDGACSRNGYQGAKAGYGVFWGYDHPDNTCGPVHGAPTNNRGELLAVDVALKQAIRNNMSCIIVRTDSQLLMKSLDIYMEKWKRKKWKTSSGESVKNQDLIRSIDDSTQRIHVKFEYVAGHSGVAGNEEADKLARLGAQMYSTLSDKGF